MTRIPLRFPLVVGLAMTAFSSGLIAAETQAVRPNVLVIITDDQGHGDFGANGNPVVRTPNLDRLSRQGVRLSHFQVAPVCAPTRAMLMTGRYNYRTGVVDTFLGRALMHTDEVTMAEVLGAAGYRTGIFGKWHLGDNAPMRPVDQGFQESLVLKGGGIGQPSDPPGGSHYFDPVLQHNGRPERRNGYCSDIYTDAAMDFVADAARQRKQPFFTYLAFNAPHTPLEVPDSYRKPYAEADLSPDRFPKEGYPLPAPAPKDVTARIYGMVTNIDDNIGRLLTRLDTLGIADNTLVIFLTDNGPQQVRYNSGLRGLKTTVYDGGIRVPCYVRWPGRLEPGRVVDRIASPIDLMPTLLEACGVARPAGVALDGLSLWPLLTGQTRNADWPDRTLFTQWHRGDAPEKFRAFAARSQRYKLVRAEAQRPASAPPFELFDMEADPYERFDVSAAHPEVVSQLKSAYSSWFDDVSRTRGYEPAPRIQIGSPRENPTVLTRQDWRGPHAGWAPNNLGHWDVEAVQAGNYDVSVTLSSVASDGSLELSVNGVARTAKIRKGDTECVLGSYPLTPSSGRVEMSVTQPGPIQGFTVESVTIKLSRE